MLVRFWSVLSLGVMCAITCEILAAQQRDPILSVLDDADGTEKLLAIALLRSCGLDSLTSNAQTQLAEALVLDPLGNVHRNITEVSESQTVVVGVLGPAKILPLLAVQRTTEAADRDVVRYVGVEGGGSVAPLLSRDDGTEPLGPCAAARFEINGLSAPRTKLRVAMAGGSLPPTETGSVDFAVRREYSAAVSAGTVYSFVDVEKRTKLVSGADSMLAVDSVASGAHQTIFFSYIVDGPKTRDSQWVGASLGFDISSPADNAFLGLAFSLNSVFMVQAGVHVAQVKARPESFDLQDGASVNNIPLPEIEKWQFGPYVGFTIDALAAAAAFKSFLTFSPGS